MARKGWNWGTIGANVGGATSMLLLVILRIWRGGALVVLLWTFLWIGMGSAIGVGLQHLADKRNE